MSAWKIVEFWSTIHTPNTQNIINTVFTNQQAVL
jgi:hypothetical protein